MKKNKRKYRLPFRPSKKIIRVKHTDCPAHYKMKPSCPWAIDFEMEEGTKILAARAGKVIYRESRYTKNYKNMKKADRCNVITLEHPDGEFSIYAHLKWRSVFPKLRDCVKQGEVIGLSGNTGYSTGPHLHFHVEDKDGKNKRVYFMKGNK